MNQGNNAAAAIFVTSGLLTTPAMAASGGQSTGIVSIAPATVLITLALAIVLTLIGRPLLSSVSARIELGLQRKRVLAKLRSVGSQSLNDFILPGSSGGLVPVDHAVLVPGGVVCLQVKYYKGTVFTNNGGTQWSCADGGQRHRFMSPVMQNETRLQAIRQAVPELPTRGLVVFAGPVEFPDGWPEGVVSIDELCEAMEAMEFETAASREIEDWDATWFRLQAAALTDDDSRKDLDAQVSFG